MENHLAVHYTDQLHRPLHFNYPPKRIISLVPSQTELLVSLGLENQLVGITKFCVHPNHLKSNKTIVGGTKTIKIGLIKSLQPDIIICNKEENTQEIVAECEQITQVYVSDIATLTTNFEFIKTMGALFSKEKIADNLIDKLHIKYNDFKAFIAAKKRKRVAYFIWRDPWMVAGGSTFINELLDLNGFDNVFGKVKRYPEIELGELVSKDLDMILLSSEPYPFKELHKKELQKFSTAKITLVDGEAFSWHGSRLLKALDYFKTLH